MKKESIEWNMKYTAKISLNKKNVGSTTERTEHDKRVIITADTFEQAKTKAEGKIRDKYKYLGVVTKITFGKKKDTPHKPKITKNKNQRTFDELDLILD
jgi:hypothetical protein